MHKSSLLPKEPEEKNSLIKAIQEQINKISAEDLSASAQSSQKKAILEERLRLIKKCEEYSEGRISNIQKIFKHYSTHLFRSGQKYDFDQIGYLNQHLIMQRFFAFINDFQLNQVQFNGEICQLADRNSIILIFKKASSNARNLDLPEFIACLQRLFVFLFNQNQGFKEKRQKMQRQKQQRAQQAKKRQKQKQQKIKAKAKNAAVNQDTSNKLGPPPKIDNPQSKSLKQNDEMMNQMMKDFQIVNPIEEVSSAVQKVKHQNAVDHLYIITDSQKIESYWQRIGIDDKKQLDKKIRYFEKANFKYFQVEELQKYRPGNSKKRQEEKGNQPLNLKSELTSIHDQWKNQKRQIEKLNASRILNVVDKLSEREQLKGKLHISRSLSREDYDKKRKKMDQKFTRRQLDLMFPTAKERINKRKESGEETAYYNLEMLHRSTPHQVPIGKILPDRYISTDPTDSIYLQQYGARRAVNRAQSSFSRDKSQIIESTKRRASELQNQQAKRISRLTVNLHQNQHYLQKFLERKW